jgi:hypothetical protein
LFPIKLHLDEILHAIIPISKTCRYFHNFQFEQVWFLCSPLSSVNYPVIVAISCLIRFTTENVEHSRLFTDHFHKSFSSNLYLVLRRIQFVLLPVLNFQHSDWLIFVSFILYSTTSILLSSLYQYSSFTFDCFTLLVLLPKNKIRSIINSFKLLNTELP